MTSNVDDLLQEILKDPSSDPPRLVVADHLEQTGELDRASLIHLQIRRASLPAWDAQALELELQERAILIKREREWRATLPQLEGVRWGRFSRGFVGKVAFDSVEAFARHHAQCLSAAPVHSVVLRWPRSAKPTKLASIETIRELTLVGTVMKPEDLKWLAASPLLTTIRSLNLIDSEIRSGLPHLLKSPYLGKLEALRMPLHHLGNVGLAKLLAASLPSLNELDLSVGGDEELGSGRRYSAGSITSKGVLEMSAWPGLARIQSLDLSGSKLGSDGLLMLLASPYTKALKTLRVRDIKDSNWDMDDSLTAFKSGPFGSLDELDISNNDLDPDGARYLAESRALKELKVLRLDNVRSKSFDRLAKASWLRSSLHVVSCGESALPHLLHGTPEHLHTIKVTATSAPLSKVVHHLEAEPPPALRSLDLATSRIDDDGLRRLGELDSDLVSVALPHTRAHFSLDAVTAFARSPLGTRLASLDTGVAELDRNPAPTPLDIGDGEYEGPFRFL